MNKIDKKLHFLLGKVKEECKKIKNLSDYELKNKTNEFKEDQLMVKQRKIFFQKRLRYAARQIIVYQVCFLMMYKFWEELHFICAIYVK